MRSVVGAGVWRGVVGGGVGGGVGLFVVGVVGGGCVITLDLELTDVRMLGGRVNGFSGLG